MDQQRCSCLKRLYMNEPYEYLLAFADSVVEVSVRQLYRKNEYGVHV